MSRPKPAVEGKRVNVWIPPEFLDIHGEIENFSAFVQVSLTQAPDIMTFAILHDVDPKKYHYRAKLEDVKDNFNKKFPLDPLTAKRQGKWQDNSPKLPDALS